MITTFIVKTALFQSFTKDIVCRTTLHAMAAVIVGISMPSVLKAFVIATKATENWISFKFLLKPNKSSESC